MPKNVRTINPDELAIMHQLWLRAAQGEVLEFWFSNQSSSPRPSRNRRESFRAKLYQSNARYLHEPEAYPENVLRAFYTVRIAKVERLDAQGQREYGLKMYLGTKSDDIAEVLGQLPPAEPIPTTPTALPTAQPSTDAVIASSQALLDKLMGNAHGEPVPPRKYY